jgi:predicted transcriptional regulator
MPSIEIDEETVQRLDNLAVEDESSTMSSTNSSTSTKPRS